jgi:hypothetical protein
MGEAEPMVFHVALENTGVPRQVVVEAVITREGSQEPVSGLLLRTLKDFEGRASWSDIWDSGPFEAGYYTIHVFVKDAQGTVLDSKTETYRLGVVSGRIENFAVSPEHFEIGDRVHMSLDLANIGTVNIQGAATMRIQDSAGEIISELVHEIPDLPPAETMTFEAEWDTTRTPPGPHHVIGYARYDGMTTDPLVQIISTSSCLGDLDHDGDVDGKDLAEFIENIENGPGDLGGFSEQFGRTDCY